MNLERLEQRVLLASDVQFDVVEHIGVAEEAHGLSAADVDSDGDQDLVLSGGNDAALFLLLNDGSGGFSVGDPAETDMTFPWFNAIGDLDGDDLPDVVVGMGNEAAVSVLKGNGAQPLLPPVKYSTGGEITGDVALGDFDQDGDLDIASTHQYSHDVSVMLGNGDLTFSEPSLYPSGGKGTTGIATGDFDGDSDLDLAVANYFAGSGYNTVGVLLGDGQGSFESAVTYDAGNPSWDLENADVNHDGAVDLVVSTTGGPSVLLGNGDGTFQDGELHDTWPEGADWRNPDPDDPILQPYGLDLGDINGDGVVDLVLANWSGRDPRTRQQFGMLSVMLGSGNGSFGEPVTIEAAIWPRAVIMVDLDNDGDLDLAASGKGSDLLTLLFNTTAPARIAGDANGDGRFDQLDIVQVLQAGKYLSGQPATFEEGDWNGDGVFDQQDVVAALRSGSRSERM